MNIIAIELVLIALGYVIVSVTAQRKFSNIKRIKEIKVEMNAKVAELKKMGNDASKEIMAEKQKEMATLTSEMMRHQLKSSLIILPIFVVLVYFALPYEFANQPFNLTIMSIPFTYRTFFVVAAFIFGMISSIAIAIYDKMAAKKAEETTQTAMNNAKTNDTKGV